jgi:Stress responsive A/B Barrel Domain
MIRHVVQFTLKSSDPEERRQDAAGIRERITALVGVVPGMLSAEVGEDLGLVEGHRDVVLITEHESNTALEGYQSHPAHLEAAEWIEGVISGLSTVDYAR